MILDPLPLGIVALTAHARHVPSETRERFGDTAAALVDDGRAILLRTCHRVELYVADTDPPELILPDLPPGGVRLTDHDAVRHLFAVAAGLESVVVGEDQILHQVRDCLSARHPGEPDEAVAGAPAGRLRTAAPRGDPAPLRPVLDRMFQSALRVGRQSRAWREGQPRSLADTALDRIEATAGPLAGRPLLVVGAGRMSRLTALAAGRRQAAVVVTNRSPERAAALASDVGGTSVPFGSVPDSLTAVVAAVSGPWELQAAAERSLVEGTASVVDLSSPPSVAHALRERLGSRFSSVDDIAAGPSVAMRARHRGRIERLIEDADVELTRWFAARSAVPAIQALTEQAEVRRAAEMDRLIRRLPHLDDHDRAIVDQMSRRLVAGLLHAPLSSLREDQTGDQDRAVRDLFSL